MCPPREVGVVEPDAVLGGDRQGALRREVHPGDASGIALVRQGHPLGVQVEDPEAASFEAGGEKAPAGREGEGGEGPRSEEHTSELQSLMRISYAVFCLKKKK